MLSTLKQKASTNTIHTEIVKSSLSIKRKLTAARFVDFRALIARLKG